MAAKLALGSRGTDLCARCCGLSLVVVVALLTSCVGEVVTSDYAGQDDEAYPEQPHSRQPTTGEESEPCNGYDDDRDGWVDEDCPCTAGETQPCFPDHPSILLGHDGGACRHGQQRCEGGDEFGRWGVCVDAVLPSPEMCQDGIDNDCDGQTDCDDPDCEEDRQCVADKCAGGAIKIDDLWYCGVACPDGGVGIASAPSAAGANGGACGEGVGFGAGGTVTPNCAGTYQVCAVLKSLTTGEVCEEKCVEVTAPVAGATVPLPSFPGFETCSDCTANAAKKGGETCLRVRGTTVDGVAVDKEVFCGWKFVTGYGGGPDYPVPGDGTW